MRRSGGISDAVAYHYAIAIEPEIHGLEKEEPPEQIKQLFQYLELITIHDEAKDGDLDISVFRAVVKKGIKGKFTFVIEGNGIKKLKDNEIDQERLLAEQVVLGLEYDQYRFVYAEILEHGLKVVKNVKDHEKCLQLAFTLNKPEFVDLLISDDYNIQKFGSPRVLSNLYKNINLRSDESLLFKLGFIEKANSPEQVAVNISVLNQAAKIDIDTLD